MTQLPYTPHTPNEREAKASWALLAVFRVVAIGAGVYHMATNDSTPRNMKAALPAVHKTETKKYSKSIETLFSRYDTNNNGELEQREAISLVRDLDTNRDNALSKEELSTLLK
tara:strand:- start:7034 stop:7372 length:339 start_codon:yes stop_codon:yes gene_type:complete